MKKFERLPAEQRREEIRAAALQLFNEKGFAATTMENIIGKVSLSKGGVYRIYPSTSAILEDLIISGMHMRNAYYAECAGKAEAEGTKLTLQNIVEMICDSLIMYPEISSVYVEFLWEKRRNSSLEELYRKICDVTVSETSALMEEHGAGMLDGQMMERLMDIMNTAVLSMHVLGLKDFYAEHREQLCAAIIDIIKI